MGFQKAVKTKAKLRCAIFGPAGSGKTYSSLAIATGMGGKIALIDSERGSASKYADRFSFDTVDLEEKNIDEYCSFIKEAGSLGYNVLVVDSLSHAWQELLDEVEKLAQAKYRGNTWSAWSEGTPKQRKLVEAIVSSPCHVIATMRSKTEWQTASDGNGKSKPVRVGLAPEQGKGIEYEFDLLLELSTEHLGNVIKDRTGKFQDKILEKPGVDFGKALIEWLNSGAELLPRASAPAAAAPTTESKPAEQSEALKDVLKKIADAKNKTELEAIAEAAGKLEEEEKKIAADAYRKRRAELKKAATK